MEVVLNKDVSGLGYRGDVVAVKNGYFRNFLLPKGFAVLATAKMKEFADARKEKMLLEKEKLLENAKEALGKLEGLKIVLSVKASKKGKLYAAITENDVIDAVLKEKNVRLESNFIKMDHFKELGEYKVLVDLGDKLTQEIDLVVEPAE